MSESDPEPFITLFRGNLEQIASPVKFLWPHACVRLKRVSPSTKERCISSMRRIFLNLVDERRFVCKVTPATGEVLISTGVLSLLWACSHLNMAHYALIRDSDLGGAQNESEGHLAFKKAFDLVVWALEHVFGDDDPGPWPCDLPCPQAELVRTSPVFSSSALALGSLAFIILHEIAHVLLGHGRAPTRNESHQQEFAADALAVELFLDGAASMGEGTVEARTLDVVTVMFALCLNPMLTRHWSWRTHPPEWQRLDRVIAQLNLDDGDQVLVFARQIKILYSAISNREPGLAEETPTEALNRFFDGLSEETREEPPTRQF